MDEKSNCKIQVYKVNQKLEKLTVQNSYIQTFFVFAVSQKNISKLKNFCYNIKRQKRVE